MNTKLAKQFDVDVKEFDDNTPFPWLDAEEREELLAVDRLEAKSHRFHPAAKNDAYYLGWAEELPTEMLVQIADRSFDQLAVFWSVLPPNSKIRARFEQHLKADAGFVYALDLRRKRQANGY